MTKLSVNVNRIATLRNTRANGIPDPVHLAEIALGAGGITVHPRPDQRHIRSEDVDALAALLARHPRAEYNIEGNPFHGLVEHSCRTGERKSERRTRGSAEPAAAARSQPLASVVLDAVPSVLGIVAADAIDGQ